jgi:GxxExxY protein
MELAMRRLRYVTQHTLPIVYTGRTLDTHYRVDLIVEDCVVVEVKSRGEADGRGEARR